MRRSAMSSVASVKSRKHPRPLSLLTTLLPAPVSDHPADRLTLPYHRRSMPIATVTLECGLVLLVENIPGVRSAALSWLLPSGAATDPADKDGLAALLSEMIMRGCGGLSSREHSDALDRLGVNRGSDVSAHHLRIDATLTADRLDDALPLIANMVIAPGAGRMSIWKRCRASRCSRSTAWRMSRSIWRCCACASGISRRRSDATATASAK